MQRRAGFEICTLIQIRVYTASKVSHSSIEMWVSSKKFFVANVWLIALHFLSERTVLQQWSCMTHEWAVIQWRLSSTCVRDYVAVQQHAFKRVRLSWSLVCSNGLLHCIFFQTFDVRCIVWTDVTLIFTRHCGKVICCGKNRGVSLNNVIIYTVLFQWFFKHDLYQRWPTFPCIRTTAIFG